MTIGLLYGDFIFDAVLTVLHAVKIVDNFYKILYEHIKQGVVGCVYVFCLKFPGVHFCQELTKFDDI